MSLSLGGRECRESGPAPQQPGQNGGHPALSSFCPGEIDSGDRGDEFPRHVQRTSEFNLLCFWSNKGG